MEQTPDTPVESQPPAETPAAPPPTQPSDPPPPDGGMDWQAMGKGILDTALRVIKDPVGFFHDMSKTGGFADPLLFVVAMAVVTGVVQVLLGILHLGMVRSVRMGLLAVVVIPLLVSALSFVGAGILHGIWRLMGSTQSYEASYRSAAYMGVLAPIGAIVHIVPYLGTIVMALAGLYLVVCATVEVHGIPAKKAWMVFGILSALLCLMQLGGERRERRAHRVARSLERSMPVSAPARQREGPRTLRDFEEGEMTPEEAGRAVGEFIKGLRQVAGDQSTQEQE